MCPWKGHWGPTPSALCIPPPLSERPPSLHTLPRTTLPQAPCSGSDRSQTETSKTVFLSRFCHSDGKLTQSVIIVHCSTWSSIRSWGQVENVSGALKTPPNPGDSEVRTQRSDTCPGNPWEGRGLYSCWLPRSVQGGSERQDRDGKFLLDCWKDEHTDRISHECWETY